MRFRRLAPAVVGAALLIVTGIVSAPPSFANGNCVSYFAGHGTGTPLDPYLVGSQLDLNEIRWCTSSSFLQVSDIALTGSWTPIDNIYGSNGPFTGTFDGDGHSISGLSVSGADSMGLFSSATGATIRHFSISGSVSGHNFVGAIVGDAIGTTIDRVTSDVNVTATGIASGGLAGRFTVGSIAASSVAGAVNGNGDTGGLVGVMQSGAAVSNSTVTGAVSSGSAYLGGIAGFVVSGNISRSSVTGSVTGDSHVGGIVGAQGTGSLASSFSTGSVTGTAYVGGVAGQVDTGTAVVSDVYSRGVVTATSTGYVGTIFGYDAAGNSSTVSHAYGTGQVLGPHAGGIAGFVGGINMISAFWDTQSTAQSIAFGTGSASGATGVDTASMTSLATYQSAGWSISSNWSASGATWGICSNVNDGYPYLQAFYSANPCSLGDSSQYPRVAMQQFAVSAGTTVTQCALLAPSWVDWQALGSLRSRGWTLTYADWPNDHAGGWVCSRQPYWTGSQWSFRS